MTTTSELAEKLGLNPVLATEGLTGVVFFDKGVKERIERLTPTEDVLSAIAKVSKFGHTDFETITRMGFVTRLSRRSGLFEVRKNGVRFYGGRLPSTEVSDRTKSIYVLLASEQKSGKSEADPQLLDDCEKRFVVLKAAFDEAAGTTVGGRKR